MYGSSGDAVVAQEAGVRLNSCLEEEEKEEEEEEEAVTAEEMAEEEAICSITRQLVVDPVTNQWRLLGFFFLLSLSLSLDSFLLVCKIEAANEESAPKLYDSIYGTPTVTSWG